MKQYFLEIHAAEHCNLNCSGCSHYSPLAEPEYADINTVISDLKRMSELGLEDCKAIHVMGGEPLLNPELTELMIGIRREAGTDIPVELVTNGILLHEQPEEFWECCRVCSIIIRPTIYDIHVDYGELEQFVKQKGVCYSSYSRPGEIKSFKRFLVNENGLFDSAEMYERCGMSDRFLLLKKGKLFRCSIIANIEHLNLFFGCDFQVTSSDYVDIYSANSMEQIERLLDEPPAFCRYCDVEAREKCSWSFTDYERTEWITE